MSNQTSFITFEQASKLNQLQPIAEQYASMVQQINYFFQKNSAAQFANFEIYGRALDLSKYYFEKDYSNFLFDETKKLFEEFEKLQPDLIKLKEKMVSVAEVVSKVELKTSSIDKKTKEDEQK